MDKNKLSNKAFKGEVKNKAIDNDSLHDKALEYASKHNLTLKQAKEKISKV